MKTHHHTHSNLTPSLLIFGIASCLSIAPLTAQDKEAPQGSGQPQAESTEQIVKRLVDLGPGVHEIKKDPSGKLKSLKVVGQARISSVLGNAKGLEVAQQKAKLSAQQSYIQWLTTNASSVEVNDEETVITLSGDGEKTTEQGKGSEKITNVIKSHSDGLIRGLALVGKDVNADGETLTLIYIWSPTRAAQAVDAAKANSGKEGSGTASGGESQSNKKGIESKTTVSPDFNE